MLKRKKPIRLTNPRLVHLCDNLHLLIAQKVGIISSLTYTKNHLSKKDYAVLMRRHETELDHLIEAQKFAFNSISADYKKLHKIVINE